MLIPFITVTAIGLAVALRRQGRTARIAPLLGAGLIGAWVGYLAGAIVGGVVEAILFGGFWSVLVGHLGAVAVARLTVTNRNRMALSG